MLTAREFLGVGDFATEEEIHAAYRRLAILYHPDKHGNSRVFKRRFVVIQSAYAAASEGSPERIFPVWDHVDIPQASCCVSCGWPLSNPYVCPICGQVCASKDADIINRQNVWRHARLYSLQARRGVQLARQIYRDHFGHEPDTGGTRRLRS